MANNNTIPPPPSGYQVQPSAPPPPPPDGYSLSAPGPNDIVANQRGNFTVQEDYTKLPKSWATIKASLPTDPAAKTAILAKALFPDMSPQDSMSRFGVMGGRVFYVDNDGKAYYAEPKFAPVTDPIRTLKDLPDTLAAHVGPSLPAIGGITGGVVTDWAGGVPGAMAGGAAGDALRQALANIFTGEQKPIIDRLLQTGSQAALQGAGQMTGNLLNTGAKTVFNSNPLKVAGFDMPQVTPQAISQAQLLTDTANRAGVTITPGEATNLPSLLTRQRQVGTNPASMNIMGDLYKDRNFNQLPAAYGGMLSNISPQAASDIGARSLQQGAKNTMTAAVKARSDAAAPLYEAAYAANPSISSPELDLILKTPAGREALRNTATALQNDRTLLGVSDPEMTAAKNEAVALGKMADPDTGGTGVASGLKLQTYDLIKRQLYDMEQAAKDPQTGRATFQSDSIGRLRQQLTAQLDKLDATAAAGPNSLKPGGGLYQQARNTFQAGSPAVTELDNGPVALAAADRPTNFKQVPNTIFGPGADSMSISQARNAFSKAGQMDAWNDGLRSYLQNIYDIGAKQDQGPAKSVWRTLAGDQRQMANMRAAMTPEQFDAFRNMMDIFEAAARAPAEGSRTATDLGAGADLRSGAAKAASATLRGTKFWDIPTAMANIIDQSATANGSRAMANVITSPNAINSLQRLKMLSPGTEKFNKEMGYLTSIIAYGNLMPSPNDQAPSYLSGLPQNMQPTFQ